MMNIHCQPNFGTTTAPTMPDASKPTGKII
jgi:hypothetical protein